MAIGSNKVRIQVIVDRDISERIEELAKLMDVSTSRMCARLLDEAVKDNDWIIRKIAAPIRKLLDRGLRMKGARHEQA